MNCAKIIVILLILSQSAVCMELATQLEEIITKNHIQPLQLNKNDLAKLDIITKEVEDILLEREKAIINDITNEVIKISKQYSLIELKALVAYNRGDLLNAIKLEKKATQKKCLEQEKENATKLKEVNAKYKQLQEAQETTAKKKNKKKTNGNEKQIRRMQTAIENKSKNEQKIKAKILKTKELKTNNSSNKISHKKILPDVPTTPTNTTSSKNEPKINNNISLDDNYNIASQTDLKKMLEDFHNGATICLDLENKTISSFY